MNQRFPLLRMWLRFKRDLICVLNWKKNSVSLIRKETKLTLKANALSKYSNSDHLSIFDSRNSRFWGHYFDVRYSFLVEDVVVEPRQGLIYSRNGELVEESSSWDASYVYNSFPLNNVNFAASSELEFVICISSNSYWHWLIEDLPSCIWLLNSFPNAKVIISKFAPRYVTDFLDAYNREIFHLNGLTRVKSIYLVERKNDSGWPHPYDIQVLKSLREDVKLKIPRKVKSRRNFEEFEKLYVSRENSARSPKNEKDVREMFENYGFKSVMLEDFYFWDEVELFSSVSVLAGIHGAGMANMVWMKEESHLIDIANEDYWTESPHRLAAILKVGYHGFTYPGPLKATVDIEKLSDFLNGLSFISEDNA